MGLLFEVTRMPAVSTGQDGVKVTAIQIISNFVFLRQTMESFAWFFWSCPTHVLIIGLRCHNL